MAFGEVGAELDHFLRIVDRDDFFRPPGEELGKHAFAGAEIGNGEGRQKGEEHLGDALPGAAGTVGAAELAGELVEVFAGFILPLFEGEAKGLLVGRGGRDFPGADGEDGGKLAVDRVVGELVIDILSGAAILDEAGLAELGEVRGDPGLSHAEDFLDFDDGKLFLLEQKEEAEARLIGQKTQIFHD